MLGKQARCEDRGVSQTWDVECVIGRTAGQGTESPGRWEAAFEPGV